MHSLMLPSKQLLALPALAEALQGPLLHHSQLQQRKL